MIDHEAIIKQQMLDQTIAEEIEYGNEYGMLEELDPAFNPETLASFTEERYDYGQEEIPIGKKRQGIKAIKLA